MKKLLCFLVIMLVCLAFTEVKASNTFYDTRGTKYEGVVERMAKLGIVNGMNETTYAPYKGVTRAELAKIITKIRNLEEYSEDIEYKKIFKDVKKSDWFYPYVTIASDLGLINGYEDGTFKPNQEVTYAELVAILLRNLGYRNIKEDSENGWYWNYIVRMREIELNDNVGEFDYLKSAKRGDVAMFVWNTLITDRWSISLESEKDGFDLTYADETPLEMFFDNYLFLDNEVINYVGGKEERVIIGTNKGYFYTNEKTPLYVLGGHITALYNTKTKELIGVTFDEDYENLDIVSGPKFYLEEQGYRPTRANKVAYYGTKSKANYVYLLIDKNTGKEIRAVYLDASNSFIVDTISTKGTETSGDISTLKDVTINEQEYSTLNIGLISDGFPKNIDDAKKGDILTDLGQGLYAYSNKKITNIMNNFSIAERKMTIDEDDYIVSENCICYIHNEDEPVLYYSIPQSKLKKYIGTKLTATINVAEEICVIYFGKTEDDNNKYPIGFVTESYILKDQDAQKIKIDCGEEIIRENVKGVGDKNNFLIGELVALNDKKEVILVNRDTSFDNDIAVKYNYEAKKISYPMIGEYMVNEDTKYYKVTLEYEDNSVTKLKSCTLNEIDLGEDIGDLMAYNLTIIYDEDMEVVKVYAINEVNKFDNQIALVKDLQVYRDADKKEIIKATLSVMEDAVRGYEIQKDANKFIPGDIITFTYKESSDNRIATLEETFKKEFIGYSRDLIVKEVEKKTKIIKFENGNSMDLAKDVYDWNGTKINLNRYRFVIAEVSNKEGYYEFTTLEMHKKERIALEEGDRFAIGELQDVIVIYRGFEE